MEIMNDIRLFVLAESLNDKANNALKQFKPNIKLKVRQYEDYYSFEFYGENLQKVISINGKGLNEEAYYPEILDFIKKIVEL